MAVTEPPKLALATCKEGLQVAPVPASRATDIDIECFHHPHTSNRPPIIKKQHIRAFFMEFTHQSQSIRRKTAQLF
jgi:hypothetical protein